MKIENDMANLFVGCGITEDSDPLKEWQETYYKSQTMLQVISSML
jgi:isochorismate synthase